MAERRENAEVREMLLRLAREWMSLAAAEELGLAPPLPSGAPHTRH